MNKLIFLVLLIFLVGCIGNSDDNITGGTVIVTQEDVNEPVNDSVQVETNSETSTDENSDGY